MQRAADDRTGESSAKLRQRVMLRRPHDFTYGAEGLCGVCGGNWGAEHHQPPSGLVGRGPANSRAARARAGAAGVLQSRDSYSAPDVSPTPTCVSRRKQVD